MIDRMATCRDFLYIDVGSLLSWIRILIEGMATRLDFLYI